MALFDTTKLYRGGPLADDLRVCAHCGAEQSPSDPTPHFDDPDGMPCPVRVLEGLYLQVSLTYDFDGRTREDRSERQYTVADAEAWVAAAMEKLLGQTNHPAFEGARIALDLEDSSDSCPALYRKLQAAADAPRLAAKARSEGVLRRERTAAARRELAAHDKARGDFTAEAYARRRVAILNRYRDVVTELEEVPPGHDDVSF